MNWHFYKHSIPIFIHSLYKQRQVKYIRYLPLLQVIANPRLPFEMASCWDLSLQSHLLTVRPSNTDALSVLEVILRPLKGPLVTWRAFRVLLPSPGPTTALHVSNIRPLPIRSAFTNGLQASTRVSTGSVQCPLTAMSTSSVHWQQCSLTVLLGSMEVPYKLHVSTSCHFSKSIPFLNTWVIHV